MEKRKEIFEGLREFLTAHNKNWKPYHKDMAELLGTECIRNVEELFLDLPGNEDLLNDLKAVKVAWALLTQNIREGADLTDPIDEFTDTVYTLQSEWFLYTQLHKI